METAIVVFTRDLRLHDNPALHLACARPAAGSATPIPSSSSQTVTPRTVRHH